MLGESFPSEISTSLDKEGLRAKEKRKPALQSPGLYCQAVMGNGTYCLAWLICECPQFLTENKREKDFEETFLIKKSLTFLFTVVQ